MAYTILDVAKEAGVSKSTVSLVLNDSPKVKLETRYAVQQAIHKLGYVPNQAARELTTKHKHILGLVFVVNNPYESRYSFETNSDTFTQDVSTGIYAELAEHEYGLLSERFILNSPSLELPFLLKNNRVDGLFIVGGFFDPRIMQYVREKNLPAVVVGTTHDELDYVTPDIRAAAYLGTKHLIDAGHRDIALLSGFLRVSSTGVKIQGYRQALEDAGLAFRPEWVRTPEFTGVGGYEAMKDLWNSGIHPTAVFAGYDGIAIGVMRFLHEQGIRVPDDVSIVGYEDSILSTYSIPPMTTIRIHKEKLGQEACKILINRITHPKSQRVRLTIQCDLIERSSVKDIC